MNRFKTLLLREWMQHQRAWLILALLPMVIAAGIGLFGHAQIEFDNDGASMPGALPVALAVMAGLGAITLVIAWGASLLQAPGLARRDTQDRSIEFWLSLPAGHVQSLSATLLAHLLLMPWAALAVGAVGGVVVSLPIVVKAFGFGAWFGLPWFGLIPALFAIVLRLALGILLATLWLSPLILLTMAASAWLKRWGLPLVVGVIGVGGTVLDRLYANPVVWETLRWLTTQASRAFIAANRGGVGRGLKLDGDDIGQAVHLLPAWCFDDALAALSALASPGFVAAIAVAAAGFALLVLRRQRGA